MDQGCGQHGMLAHLWCLGVLLPQVDQLRWQVHDLQSQMQQMGLELQRQRQELEQTRAPPPPPVDPMPLVWALRLEIMCHG